MNIEKSTYIEDIEQCLHYNYKDIKYEFNEIDEQHYITFYNLFREKVIVSINDCLFDNFEQLDDIIKRTLTELLINNFLYKRSSQ